MSKTTLYIILTLLVLLVSTLLQQNLIFTDALFYEHFSRQLSLDSIEQVLKIRDRWSWIIFILIPTTYFLKITLISLWILSACILFGYKNTFSEIFKVVVTAELTWLLPPLVTVLWLGFVRTDYTLIEAHFFRPLSLASFFEISKIEPWLIFTLQAVNVFEVLYIFFLANGLKRILNKNLISAIYFTLSVYGTALITWLIFITFLNINLTS
jgi:hypothetical protein